MMKNDEKFSYRKINVHKQIYFIKVFEGCPAYIICVTSKPILVGFIRAGKGLCKE